MRQHTSQPWTLALPTPVCCECRQTTGNPSPQLLPGSSSTDEATSALEPWDQDTDMGFCSPPAPPIISPEGPGRSPDPASQVTD